MTNNYRFFSIALISCILTFSVEAQVDNQVKLRYWNGQVGGKGVVDPIGLSVSAESVKIKNALVRVDEATLSGEPPSYYFKKKFVLYFIVQNLGEKEIAIFDWAFKAVCPVDNMGREFNATSLISLVTPFIPDDIYIVLKPGEKKEFYSAETDFFWCLPQNKEDLLHDPKYFQGLITCGLVDGKSESNNPGKKLSDLNPPILTPNTQVNLLDADLEKSIVEHNNFVLNGKNREAEILNARIIKATSLAYPEQLSLIESKLKSAAPITKSEITQNDYLTFNGKKIEVDGECQNSTAILASQDESCLLIANNLGDVGTYSINSKFYTEGCLDCPAVQFQDLENSIIYVATSGTVQRTATGVTIDITVKELMALIGGGGSNYRIVAKMDCE